MSAIRDHQRAQAAHTHVKAVKSAHPDGDDFARSYGALCHKLPILVHQAGLPAALHFVAARGKPGQRELLKHLAEQVKASGLTRGEAFGDLLSAVRLADLAQLQGLTREVQRCLLWYKRCAQVELNVDAADDGGDP